MRQIGYGLNDGFRLIGSVFIEHQRKQDWHGEPKQDFRKGEHQRIGHNRGKIAIAEEILEMPPAHPGAFPNGSARQKLLPRELNSINRHESEEDNKRQSYPNHDLETDLPFEARLAPAMLPHSRLFRRRFSHTNPSYPARRPLFHANSRSITTSNRNFINHIANFYIHYTVHNAKSKPCIFGFWHSFSGFQVSIADLSCARALLFFKEPKTNRKIRNPRVFISAFLR